MTIAATYQSNRVLHGHVDSWLPYTVCQEVWTAVFGEELYAKRESGKMADLYGVAMQKDSGETVGLLPKNLTNVYHVYRW